MCGDGSKICAGEKMKQRAAALDAVRVIGIVAIVAGHTWDSDGLHRVIGFWQVPVFFILSGYLWTGRRSIATDVRHRATSLARPYAIWLGIFGLPLLAWTAYTAPERAMRLADRLLTAPQIGRPFSAFWFVSVLFVAGFAMRLCQRLPRVVWWPMLLIGAAATTAWGPMLARTSYSVGMVPVAVLFMQAGRELKMVRARLAPLVGPIFLIVGVGLTSVSGRFDMKYGELGAPVFGLAAALLLGVGGILIAELLVPHLPHRVQEAATALSRAGLLVILTHAAVLYVAQGLASLPNAVCLALAVLLPWTFGLLAVRQRWSWLTGQLHHRQPPVPSAPAGAHQHRRMHLAAESVE